MNYIIEHMEMMRLYTSHRRYRSKDTKTSLACHLPNSLKQHNEKTCPSGSALSVLRE